MKSVRDFVDIRNIDCMVPIQYDIDFRHRIWFITSNRLTYVRINITRKLYNPIWNKLAKNISAY